MTSLGEVLGYRDVSVKWGWKEDDESSDGMNLIRSMVKVLLWPGLGWTMTQILWLLRASTHMGETY